MLIVIYLFLGSAQVRSGATITYNDTSRLLGDLFKDSNYNKNIRPIANQSDALKVNITHLLRDINYIDLRTGDFLTQSAIILSWRDEMLSWNPADYGGIEMITFPEANLWQPNIIITEGGQNDGLRFSESGYSFTWGTYTGIVFQILSGYVRSTCAIQSSYFPFDSHECAITYICQRYSASELVLTHVGEDWILDSYTENKEWTIADIKATEAVYNQRGLVWNVSLVQVSIHVARRPTFEIISVHIPAILLSLVSPAACLIPVSGGERLSFLITLFVAFVFMFTSHNNEMPRDSLTMPYVSGLFLAMLAQNTLNIIWNIFIVRVGTYSVDKHPVPRPLKCLIKCCLNKKSRKINDVPTCDCPSENEDTTIQRQNDCKTEDVQWTDVCHVLDKFAFLFQVVFILTLMIIYLYMSTFSLD